jgi:hypothetical protein
MKKLFVASLIATMLAASTAFAFEARASQPVKGTEGPDIRLTADRQSTQPVKGTEGPDIRRADDRQSTQPVKGTEGPDIRRTEV